MIERVAMLSVHGSPLAAIGHKDAGGMNVYLGELSRELGRRNINVDVFTRGASGEVTIHHPASGVRVIDLPVGPPGPLDKNDLFPHLPEFLDGVQQFAQSAGTHYQLVHSHYWLSAWAGQRLADDWEVPSVTMYHTLGRVKQYHRVGEVETPLRIAVERETLASVDVVVAGSETERRQTARLYGVPMQKIVTISPGVDLARFKPLGKVAARQHLGASLEARVVLFVGRIEPLKGIDILVRAAAAMENRQHLEVWIVGGDESAAAELRRLTNLARRLGVAEQLRFFGSIPHDELPWYYSAADVCAVPSYYESFGMVALEALACGTPVVASRVGGLQETVHDGENGYLLSWRCPEPFAEKLETLLGNPGLHRSFSQNAVATARRYAWPMVGRRMLELYECLVEAGDCGFSQRTWRKRAS